MWASGWLVAHKHSSTLFSGFITVKNLGITTYRRKGPLSHNVVRRLHASMTHDQATDLQSLSQVTWINFPEKFPFKIELQASGEDMHTHTHAHARTRTHTHCTARLSAERRLVLTNRREVGGWSVAQCTYLLVSYQSADTGAYCLLSYIAIL